MNYVVQPGDTINSIAARFGVPVRELIRVNGLTPPYIIYIGQTLYIPTQRPIPPRPTPPGPAPAPGNVERRLQRLENRVDRLENRVDRLDREVRDLDRRVDRLESPRPMPPRPQPRQ